MSKRKLATILAAAAAVACGSSADQPAASPATTACGIAFETLPGWKLADTSSSAAGCFIRLEIEDRARSSESSIIGEFDVNITVGPGARDSIVTEQGFAQRDSGWVVLGRMGAESAAVEFGRGDWRGVQGVAEVGCSSRVDSTYAGLCDMSRAVIGDGKVTVVIDAGPGGAEAFQRVLMTLRSATPIR